VRHLHLARAWAGTYLPTALPAPQWRLQNVGVFVAAGLKQAFTYSITDLYAGHCTLSAALPSWTSLERWNTARLEKLSLYPISGETRGLMRTCWHQATLGTRRVMNVGGARLSLGQLTWRAIGMRCLHNGAAAIAASAAWRGVARRRRVSLAWRGRTAAAIKATFGGNA